MRLIDADALMERCYADMRNDEVLWRIPPNAVDNAPTVDAVPVVRCKDCESWHPASDTTVPYCDYMIDFSIRTQDDFCSYGKQKAVSENATTTKGGEE